MNEKKVQELLRQYLTSKIKTPLKLKIKSVTWRVETASKGDLVFYNVKDNDKSRANFLEKYHLASNVLFVIPDISGFEDCERALKVQRESWLECQKIICDELFGRISEEVKLIGITGTNGKTSTADFCLQLACLQGRKAISVGTLGVKACENTRYDFGLTSPPYIEIRKILNSYPEVELFIFEVSSHALDQDRFYKMEFDAAAWTGFSRDHLDYHLTEENYFNSKKKLLSKLKKGLPAYVPMSETNLYKRLKGCNARYAKEVELSESILLKAPFLAARFNKANLELALQLLCEVFGDEVYSVSLEKLKSVEGRFVSFIKNQFVAIVDFAHTPDALLNILIETRKAFPEKSLLVLFGCGGDRDKGKRPEMGKVADQFADKIYLTSDNPRYENRMEIINDIKDGIKKLEVEVEVDREKCIKKAFNDNRFANAVLVIAGKGHEGYIDEMGKKTSYSDIETIQDLMASI